MFGEEFQNVLFEKNITRLVVGLGELLEWYMDGRLIKVTMQRA